jgi:hypothetical protein
MIKKSLILMCFLVLFTTGCVYSNIQRPLDTDFHNTELGSKEGRATNRSILWLFAWGDAGTRAAAENGDISIINHADQKFMFVAFGLYFHITTIVYGD